MSSGIAVDKHIMNSQMLVTDRYVGSASKQDLASAPFGHPNMSQPKLAAPYKAVMLQKLNNA